VARVELEVRVRVGDGEWLSPGAGVFTGDDAEDINHQIADSLRELASELDTAGAAAAQDRLGRMSYRGPARDDG
jgi:hypothetical protein